MPGLIIKDTPDKIFEVLQELHPNINAVMRYARARVGAGKTKREINVYQSAALYHIVNRLPGRNQRILEVGTALGWSSAIMAQAAPYAQIETLNVRADEAKRARQALDVFPNVMVSIVDSHKLVREYDGPPYDLIFIDGDHAGVIHDMPWFNHLKVGGVMVHHDYSPAESARPCPPVFECLNNWRASMGREFDILVVDSDDVGMAGYIRQDGEQWPMQP